MANSSTPTGLRDLPGEILNEVAGYLSKRSFSALRLTSRSIEANTYHNFIHRNFKHLHLDLDLPNIRYVMTQLRPYNVAYQVKHIIFTDAKSTGSTQPTDELYTLLREILGLLPSLTGVTIIGGSAAISQVFRLLGEQSPCHLTSFSLRGSQTPAEPLNGVLRCHKDSLRSMNLHYVQCPGSSWNSTLELMRDELNLETLVMSDFRSNDQYLDNVGFFWGPGRRHNGAIRDPVTRKIQTYGIGCCSARMMGRLAVKEGLTFIVPRLAQCSIGQIHY